MSQHVRFRGGRPALPMLFLLAALAVVSGGCGAAGDGAADADTIDADGATVTVDGWNQYGAGTPGGDFFVLADVLADPAAHDGKTVRLEAQIDEVCQAKGCWMTLDGDAGPSDVRVTFADYAFFVPKDIAGRPVRVEGTFEVREVPVDEARHYLEDAGKPEEAAQITEPQRGYRIVATGVGVQAQP